MWQYWVAKGVQDTAKIYGTIASDNRQRAASSAQASTLENNAILADFEAQQAVDLGVLNIRRFKKQIAQTQASTRVRAASSGIVVNEGSALDVLVSNAGEAAREESIMRYQTNLQAFNKTVEANNNRYQAAIVRASAPSGLDTAISVLGTIAGAVASASSSGGGGVTQLEGGVQYAG